MIQKLLDDYELEFDGYTDKCCIAKTEIIEMLKEYAILMCIRQKQLCAENAKDSKYGFYEELTLNSPLPKELQS